MQISPEPPFFLIQKDDFDVNVFQDLRELPGIVEPPELKGGVFVLFDSTGRRARLDVRGWDVVAADWTKVPDVDEFASLLRQIVAQAGESPLAEEATPELISQAAIVAARLQAEERKPLRWWKQRRGRTSSS